MPGSNSHDITNDRRIAATYNDHVAAFRMPHGLRAAMESQLHPANSTFTAVLPGVEIKIKPGWPDNTLKT
jgi:hypothetical protein